MRWISTFFLLSLAPSVFGLQSSRNFKYFYDEGNQLYGQSQFEQALEKYQEAFRLEPKAQRYKTEGAFFESYLPRYRMALCFAEIDILKAEEWVLKSREALESDVVKRQRKVLAQYNADLTRILDQAKQARKKVESQFQLALREADTLLTQKKFEQAKTSFQNLYKQFPERPEVLTGLSRVDQDRDNHLKSLVLDAKTALVERQFGKVSGSLARIEALDPAYPELSDLRARLEQAQKPVTQPVETIADARPPREENRPPEQITTQTQQKPSEESHTRPIAQNDTPPNQLPEEQDDSEEIKLRVRTALLASLKPYRRGDPQAALARLSDLDQQEAEPFGSYHWLKAVYLLSSTHHDPQSLDSIRSQARQAMRRTLELLPEFQPDPKLFPPHIIQFFSNQDSGMATP